VWGYSEGEYREIWSYFGETIQSVDLADFDGDGTAEIVTAAESILEPVESGVPGLSVWKYNSSGNSFYRLWEDVHTREYGLAYDSIAMGGMCVLRAGEVGEGNPGIFGIAWHPRLGGGCLYVAGKEGGDFGSITLPILSAQTLDIWPVDLAQSPRATWENRSAVWSQTYGGSLRDWGNAVVRTPDGGYIVAGGTRSFGNGDGDAFLVKVDGGGNKVWQRTYGGTKEDEALRIVAAEDGGYVVAGFTRLDGSWYSDAFIFKIDDDGNLVWEETYSGDETARSLVRSRDGGFVVAGSTLFKIDSKGQLVWDKPYDSMDVVLGADGGFVALSAITGGFRALKLDDSGEIVWDRNFTRPGMNSVKGLAQIDGGYMIAGEIEHGTQLPDAYLLLIDEQGNVVWEKDYGGLSWDSTLVALRSEDGYVVVGETWSAGAGAGDVYLLGLDGERKKLWEATYGMKDNDRVYGAAEAEDGGLVLAGETWSAGEGLSDLFLCKIGGYAWAFRGLGLEPSIVVPGRDATVLVQAETIGASSQGWGRISRVWLDLSSLHMPDAEMYDDGTRGDRIGGDGVYTALLPVIPDYPGGRHSVVARLVDDRGKQAYISAYLSVYPLGSLCVYDEGGEDWSAMGESATIATDSTRASSGLNSLFVSASSKGQVKFVPPGGYAFDSFGYESISFSLMPLDSGRFRPLVSVGIEGVVDLPKIDLYGLGQRFQSNQWTSISLPLSLFHANNQSISFVSIEVPVQGGFYLDDVRLKSAVQEHLLPAIVLLLVGAVAKLLSHQYVRGSGQIPVGDQVVSTGRTMCIGGMVSRPGGSGWS